MFQGLTVRSQCTLRHVLASVFAKNATETDPYQMFYKWGGFQWNVTHSQGCLWKELLPHLSSMFCTLITFRHPVSWRLIPPCSPSSLILQVCNLLETPPMYMEVSGYFVVQTLKRCEGKAVSAPWYWVTLSLTFWHVWVFVVWSGDVWGNTGKSSGWWLSGLT